MKAISTIPLLIATIFTDGCQVPVVPSRDYTYAVAFKADDNSYKVAYNYSCYYQHTEVVDIEPPMWRYRVIENGPDTLRIMGTLRDGSRFEVLPARFGEGYPYDAPSCSDKTEDLKSVILVLDKSDPYRVEQFDNVRSASASHKIAAIESTLKVNDAGPAAFVGSTHWPPPTVPTKRFYRISVSFYPAALWGSDPAIKEFVRSKKMTWISKGNTYPLTPWTDEDVVFLKTFRDVERDSVNSAGTGVLTFQNGSWGATPLNTSSPIQWVVGGDSGTTWVVYDDSRIEVPLDVALRFVFDTVHNQIIRFHRERVALW